MSGNEHKKLLGNRVTTLKERARHLITIAMSAAGLTPLRQILAGLPADLPAAVIVLQHIGDHSELPLILRESTSMQTKFADRDELLYSGIVYVCPPLVHAVVRPTRTVAFSTAPPIRLLRPCADWLLESAAASFGECATAVILSGRLSDGARGIVWMRKAGARTIAQTPSTCGFSSMPVAAIRTGCVDLVLPPDQIASALRAAVHRADAFVQPQGWDEPFVANN